MESSSPQTSGVSFNNCSVDNWRGLISKIIGYIVTVSGAGSEADTE